MPVSSCIELNNEAREVLLSLVWRVLDDALNGKGFELPPEPDIEALLKPAACFVTLHKDGQLRGCIGTLIVSEPLWVNACRNVYASAFNDRRFEPLLVEELSSLDIEISVLSALVPMQNQGEENLLIKLTPGVDGLLIEEGIRKAVFLPSVWSSLPKPKLFIDALKAKGGWPEGYWSTDITIHTFTTEVISKEGN